MADATVENDAVAQTDRKIGRGSARSFLFRSFAAAASFLTVLVTARGFGAEGRGIYALTSFSLSLMLSLLGGAAHALSAELAHRRARVSRLYAAAFLVAIVGGLVVLAGVFTFHFLILDWPAEHVLEFAALALPAALLIEYAMALLLTEGDVRRMHYMHLSRVALPLAALTLGAIVFPDRIYLALGLWVGAFWTLALVGFIDQRQRVGLDFHHTRGLVGRLVRRGSRISIGNGIAQINYRIDLLVVATLLPLADVGRYSVALALGETLWLLSRSVMTGAYSAIMATRSTEESVRVTTRAFRHSLGLLVIAALALGFAAAVLIVPLFGDEFRGVWVPLVLLLPGVVAYGVVEVFREFFIVRLERVREYLTMGVMSAIANVILAVVLIPPFGLAGAALSTSISYVAAGTYLLLRFSRSTGATGIRPYVPGRSELADYRRMLRRA